jgi:hypothetical protein
MRLRTYAGVAALTATIAVGSISIDDSPPARNEPFPRTEPLAVPIVYTHGPRPPYWRFQQRRP